MTIISFADEYRKRVGVRILTLTLDGRPMTVAEYRAIPQDDTSDDEGVVLGWVNLCRDQWAHTATLKARRELGIY